MPVRLNYACRIFIFWPRFFAVKDTEAYKQPAALSPAQQQAGCLSAYLA